MHIAIQYKHLLVFKLQVPLKYININTKLPFRLQERQCTINAPFAFLSFLR